MLIHHKTPGVVAVTATSTIVKIQWPEFRSDDTVRLVFDPDRDNPVHLHWGETTSTPRIVIPAGTDNYTVDWTRFDSLPTHIEAPVDQAVNIKVWRGRVV